MRCKLCSQLSHLSLMMHWMGRNLHWAETFVQSASLSSDKSATAEMMDSAASLSCVGQAAKKRAVKWFCFRLTALPPANDE
jgi:hypothetical protein